MKASGLAQESTWVYILRGMETFVHLQEADKQRGEIAWCVVIAEEWDKQKLKEPWM